MTQHTITEFLKARIAEDEATARTASPGPWTFSSIESIGGGTVYDPAVAVANVEWDNDGTRIDPRIRRRRPPRQADGTGVHIARHNPARILAECAAKRAILNIHTDRDGDCSRCSDYAWFAVLDGGDHETYPCPTVKAIAAVYSDHPDYRKEWAAL